MSGNTCNSPPARLLTMGSMRICSSSLMLRSKRWTMLCCCQAINVFNSLSAKDAKSNSHEDAYAASSGSKETTRRREVLSITQTRCNAAAMDVPENLAVGAPMTCLWRCGLASTMRKKT